MIFYEPKNEFPVCRTGFPHNRKDPMADDKYVDESWKDAVLSDKDKVEGTPTPIIGDSTPEQPAADSEYGELTFLNYLSSLVFQTMIFLGDMPNPVSNKTDQNLPQAKFLIDTLLLLREKTKNNLTKEEDDLLNGAVYELQMRFVDIHNKQGNAS